MTANSTFKAAAIAHHFETTITKFRDLLNTTNQVEIKQKLDQELKQHQEQSFLTVAFVGQYSAGKSTIISALTGRRDIKIDADIATDKTTSYDWNGIKVIDTPGLFTDRKDHDQITYEAIHKADLLIFCLTYMLFDSITVENFKKLAYDQGYAWKMMLVINKMSDEAGDEQEKITNYSQSLAEALKPNSLDKFPVCFIDAKDYCDGIDEKDDLSLEISRFSTFIDQLNNFVQDKGSLARFDTPVRISLSYVDELQLQLMRDSDEDSAFFQILDQLSRKVGKERNNLRTQVQSIILRLTSVICTEGNNLAAAVGDENFETLNLQAELNVQKYYEKAESELQETFENAIQEIRDAVKELLESDLAQTFFTYLENTFSLNQKNPNNGINVQQLKNQFKGLEIIAITAGIKLSQMATRSFMNTAKSGFLRGIDVAGGELHQGVLAVGKFVGFKFKPWQAVGVAKNIGNAAKFLGPVLGIVALGMDVLEMQQEMQREKQMSDYRREITSTFQSVAKDLEHQIQNQLHEFEQQVYHEIEKQINQVRQQQEEAVSTSNVNVKQLTAIRQEFNSILQEISDTVS
ncbi:LeoA/HP0731 family dynamin-like GTPase [Crocosphaera sp. UHCC 0190]|uniref:GTPase n=1 Tax=Crocosphaera sp. UHCC 0190 TaxID=3110246 RepID=UPI002B21C4D9|nr:LeoA/HP0731 family dynamin-like GTPase [Crocosphaera sp. UHCC 0190]MEA5510336.1 LeoA/HP0731 family dynamin-like GTPase [Crocosphaera sp. UHCC 0190]